eukprot:1656543-Rhodomonas_salina.1
MGNHITTTLPHHTTARRLPDNVRPVRSPTRIKRGLSASQFRADQKCYDTADDAHSNTTTEIAHNTR